MAARTAIRDIRLFQASYVVIGVLLADYLLSEPLHCQVSVAASSAAAAFPSLAARWRPSM